MILVVCFCLSLAADFCSARHLCSHCFCQLKAGPLEEVTCKWDISAWFQYADLRDAALLFPNSRGTHHPLWVLDTLSF